MTQAPTAQIEAVLDLTAWTVPMQGPEDFGALWNALEPSLHGRDLSRTPVHTWDAPQGTVRLEIVRLDPAAAVAGPRTTVSLVAVREAPAPADRCEVCARARRPAPRAGLRCDACAADGGSGRICGDHAVLLEGALTATCADHRPRCQECGDLASFWCAGASCRSRTAWCARHRATPPQGSGAPYCPGCHRIAFPGCEEPGCAAAGTIACDWHGPDRRPCGLKACTRHARRWQVFGPEAIGLGLCRAHGGVRDVPAEELLRQICAGAVRRRRPVLPSLQAFGHTLRNCGHRELAVDYTRVRSLLAALRSRADADGMRDLGRGMDRAATRWDRELGKLRGSAGTGEQLVERLRQLVVAQDPRYGAELARGLRLEEYKPAITSQDRSREATLWVLVPGHLREVADRGASRLTAYSGQLGVTIRLAGDRNGQRRGNR
ncbi:hypothetical protein [Streptomyces sp. NPDC018610]|uniref:hypothetical protein n=1 Tax=Streptomyces sp. NPDC018610 TaxID=3365049 RepID=UPI003788DFDB